MGESNLNPILGGLTPQLEQTEKRSLKRVRASHTFDAAVSATTAEIPLDMPPGIWKVMEVKVTSPAARAVDANGTNKYTLQIARRDSADYTTADVVFSSDFQIEPTGSGALVAFAPKAMRADAYTYANSRVDGNADSLTLLLTKGGTGANFAAGTRVDVELERAT